PPGVPFSRSSKGRAWRPRFTLGGQKRKPGPGSPPSLFSTLQLFGFRTIACGNSVGYVPTSGPTRRVIHDTSLPLRVLWGPGRATRPVGLGDRRRGRPGASVRPHSPVRKLRPVVVPPTGRP